MRYAGPTAIVGAVAFVSGLARAVWADVLARKSQVKLVDWEKEGWA